ncbi:hypothetical protein LEMLEM_LOCUS11696 [Lemmus lemmus]
MVGCHKWSLGKEAFFSIKMGKCLLTSHLGCSASSCNSYSERISAPGRLSQGALSLALCTKAAFSCLLLQGDHHHAGSHCCLLLPLLAHRHLGPAESPVWATTEE